MTREEILNELKGLNRQAIDWGSIDKCYDLDDYYQDETGLFILYEDLKEIIERREVDGN